MVTAVAMHRLFVALRPPAAIREGLAAAMQGVPGVRWQDDDQLHLTVRYIGEVDRHQAEDVAAALSRVRGKRIIARIAGAGQFAHAIWAGVAPRPLLAAVHAQVDGALRLAGIAPDTRAYLPHVTLARLPKSRSGDPAVTRWLACHAALASPDFTLDRMILFESTLGSEGARYEAMAVWPLR